MVILIEREIGGIIFSNTWISRIQTVIGEK